MKKIFVSKFFIALSIGLLNSSCSGLNPSEPYKSDTSVSSSRNVIPDSLKNSGNLFALVLSPLRDELQLMDLADNRIKFAVNTGRNPVDLSVSPNRSHILVINKLDGTISSYYREDNRRIQFTGTVGYGDMPTDLSFNNKGTEAYVVYQGSGRINILGIPNRDRPDTKSILVLTNPDSQYRPTPYKLALSNDDQSLYVIDRDSASLYIFSRENDNFVQKEIINISGLNERSSLEDILFYNDKLYISDSLNSRLIVFDTSTNKSSGTIELITDEIKIPLLPSKMAVSPVNNKLYVVNQGASSIAVVDLKAQSLLKHIQLASNSKEDSFEPSDISISANGEKIIVSNNSGRNLSLISGKNDELVRNIGTSMSRGALVPLSAIEIL